MPRAEGLSGSYVANGIVVGGMSRVGIRLKEVKSLSNWDGICGLLASWDGTYVAAGRNCSFIHAASTGGRSTKCFWPRIWMYMFSYFSSHNHQSACLCQFGTPSQIREITWAFQDRATHRVFVQSCHRMTIPQPEINGLRWFLESYSRERY